MTDFTTVSFHVFQLFVDVWGEGRQNIFGHRNEFSRDHLYDDIFFSLFMFLLRNIKKKTIFLLGNNRNTFLLLCAS